MSVVFDIFPLPDRAGMRVPLFEFQLSFQAHLRVDRFVGRVGEQVDILSLFLLVDI